MTLDPFEVLSRKLFVLTKASKIRALCRNYTDETKEFRKGLEGRLYEVFEKILLPLDLVERYRTTEKISFADVTHASETREQALIEPNGFAKVEHCLLNDPDNPLVIGLKDTIASFKNPEVAEKCWQMFIEQFENRLKLASPKPHTFCRFDFAKKLIWLGEDFGHRSFYLYWLSKHHGKEYAIDAIIVRYRFKKTKLKSFLLSNHYYLPIDLRTEIFQAADNRYTKEMLYSTSPEIVPNISKGFVWCELSTVNPLNTWFHESVGVFDLNAYVRMLAAAMQPEPFNQQDSAAGSSCPG